MNLTRRNKKMGHGIGYCVRCKEKTTIVGAINVTMKNGRPAMTGLCHQCGSKMYRILPNEVREPDA